MRLINPSKRRQGQRTHDDIKEGFTFDVERYVLDDNSSGYNLVIEALAGGGRDDGTLTKDTHGRGTTRGGKVGIIVGRKRTIFGDGRRVIEPLLRTENETGEKEDGGGSGIDARWEGPHGWASSLTGKG